MSKINTKEMARELGRAGGNATLKKYGKEHFKKIIEKRWKKQKEAQQNLSN